MRKMEGQRTQQRGKVYIQAQKRDRNWAVMKPIDTTKGKEAASSRRVKQLSHWLPGNNNHVSRIPTNPQNMLFSTSKKTTKLWKTSIQPERRERHAKSTESNSVHFYPFGTAVVHKHWLELATHNETKEEKNIMLSYKQSRRHISKVLDRNHHLVFVVEMNNVIAIAVYKWQYKKYIHIYSNNVQLNCNYLFPMNQLSSSE